MIDPFVIDEAADLILEGGAKLSEVLVGAALIRIAREAADKQESNTLNGPRVPINTFIARKEDMSRDGRLRLFKQEDGDICVAVIDEYGNSAGVEFCSVGSGGGKSPKVLAALNALALAILEDNEAEPFKAASR